MQEVVCPLCSEVENGVEVGVVDLCAARLTFSQETN